MGVEPPEQNMKKIFKQLIIILLIFGFLVPIFGFGQVPIAPGTIEAPKTIKEAEKMVDEIIVLTDKELPGIIEQIWRNEVMPIWLGMWNFFRNIWNRHFNPRIERIWQRIQELLGREIEKRKPIIEEEIQKEKEQIKKELPQVGQSLWDKLRELIR